MGVYIYVSFMKPATFVDDAFFLLLRALNKRCLLPLLSPQEAALDAVVEAIPFNDIRPILNNPLFFMLSVYVFSSFYRYLSSHKCN